MLVDAAERAEREGRWVEAYGLWRALGEQVLGFEATISVFTPVMREPLEGLARLAAVRAALLIKTHSN
jgi:hypothetical protein